MISIRERLDIIQSIHASGIDTFSSAETAAFHGRKVVEGIAFGCLVATDNGLKVVPKEAKGQWNAEEILKRLKSKNINVFPNPTTIRQSTPSELAKSGLKATLEDVPHKVLSHDEFIKIYQRLHKWLHEVNPYTSSDQMAFHQTHKSQLWSDLSKINDFIERHWLLISGHGFLCVLRDSVDGNTKVLSFAESSLV